MYNPANPYQAPGNPGQIPNWNAPYPNYYQQPQFQYQQAPQIMQNQNRIPIFGRMIGNVSEIVPNEVPMDGSVSFFPQSDYSCIYAKKWNTDGTIQTIKFVPVVDDNPTETSINDFNTALASDISDISNRLEKIEKLLSTRTSRSTKEESK